MLYKLFFGLCIITAVILSIESFIAFENKCCNQTSIVANISEDLLLTCATNRNDRSQFGSWFHDGNRIFVGKTNLQGYENIALTSNYSLKIYNVSITDVGTYFCTVGIDIIEKFEVEVQVEASEFYIEIDGNIIPDGHHILLEPNETTSAYCHVEGVRPANKLTWSINDKHLDSVHYSSNLNNVSNTFGYVSQIEFKPDTANGSITCRRICSLTNASYDIKVKFTKRWYEFGKIPDGGGDSTTQDTLIIKVILCSAVGFLLLILVCSFVIAKASLKTSVAKSSNSDGTPLSVGRRFSDILMNSLRSDNETVIATDDSPFIQRDTVTLHSKLPGDGVIEYWLSNCTASSVSDNTFITKFVCDDARVIDLKHFRTLAEKQLILDKHDNIVDLIGIELSDIPYHIYLEYVDNGTLRNFLLRNYQNKRKSSEPSTSTCSELASLDDEKLSLTRFSMEIVDGMIFLLENNFRHPVLTTSKVLMTKQGKCKLYDFVPKQFAKEKLLQTMNKTQPPLAWLSPETIFLRQYCEKADVWSFAIAMWEIFSLGETPYCGLSQDEIEKQIRNGISLSQPMCCPGAIFGMMLSSWNVDPLVRPSFQQLQHQLNAVFTSIKQTAEAETSDSSGEVDNNDYSTLDDNVRTNSYI